MSGWPTCASRLWRPLVSLLLLAGLWLWLEPGEVIDAVGPLAPTWMVLGLALTLPQMLLSAWRWRLTASRLGLSLGWAHALREYYLGMFINQVLPGGVAGDAARAWRHARASGRRGGAWRAVIIERASGQLALLLLTLLVVALSPLWQAVLGEALARLATPAWASGAALLAVLAGLLLRHLWRRPPAALAGLGDDLRRSLLSSSVWPRQLAGSLLVVVSYALVFVCAARAIGVTLPLGLLVSLVPPVLIAMLIPLALAGWGVREGAAALVWGVAGLPPAQGVAVSMAYGLLVLLASLPGALWLPGMARRGAPPGGSGAAQVQVEEGVVAAAEGSRDRAPRLGQRIDGCHGQPRPARTDQQRGHQQMQAVEHTGLQEARHRDPAALDQHPRQALGGKRIEHIARGEAAGLLGQPQTADVSGDGAGEIGLLADQVQGRGRRLAQQAQRGRHATPRVEDHAHRLAATDVANREQRIILTGSAGADDHRVDQRPEPVQVSPALKTIDIERVPAFGRDAAIQALAKLGHRQAPAMHRQRRQAVEQRAGLVADGMTCRPAAGAQAQRPIVIDRRCRVGCRLASGAQRLPGARRVEGVGQRRGHENSGPGQRHYHAQSATAGQGASGGHHASG